MIQLYAHPDSPLIKALDYNEKGYLFLFAWDNIEFYSGERFGIRSGYRHRCIPLHCTWYRIA
jgi:hypothetical protein